MKLHRFLPIVGAALLAVPSTQAEAPRQNAVIDFDETESAESGCPIAQAAVPVAGLRLASLQTTSGLQASASLGQRGALPARATRSSDDDWRRIFPLKKAKPASRLVQ